MTNIFFRFIEAPFNTGIFEVWVIGTPHSWGCKSLPVKTGLRYTQVLFKTFFTVFQSVSLTTPDTDMIIVQFILPSTDSGCDFVRGMMSIGY